MLLEAVDVIVNYEAAPEVAIGSLLSKERKIFDLLATIINAALVSAKCVTEVITLGAGSWILSYYLCNYLGCKTFRAIVEDDEFEVLLESLEEAEEPWSQVKKNLKEMISIQIN